MGDRKVATGAGVQPSRPGIWLQLSRTGKLPMVKGNQPGACLASDILEGGEGQIRALIIDGANPS